MFLIINVQNEPINNNYLGGKKQTMLGLHLVLITVIAFTTIPYKQDILWIRIFYGHNCTLLETDGIDLVWRNFTQSE